VICEELPITHISVLVENPKSLDILADEAHDAGVSISVWKQLLHRTGMDNKTPQHLINLDLETIHEPWICPNNTEATSAILEELHSTLENHDVDGSFIDLFRYPSPYYGLKSVLSRFCDSCNAKAAEMGINWEETRKGVKNSVKKISTLAMEEIVGLKDGFSRSKLFQSTLG